ncbi:J domain-containing protein [Candidatus Viadribacter manganicus]|uniref:J domain-containing protein n=1 Tax=Candidatus Viadribacter manganicus TaxID=1759059 RepID=UPI001D17B9D8|nr:J domain-containing protein [Candidatus Viadribacter manganicus]
MVLVLLALIGIFGVLFLTRLGGAYRAELQRRWPAVLFAGAAFFCLLRGLIGPAITFGSLSLLTWTLWPQIERWRQPRAAPASQDTPEDFAARRALGVGPNATPEEIRAAYRARMVQAHPDRGGSHNEAARLTAARDRLLKKKR